MKILIANAGSTSLKFRLFEMPGEDMLCEGKVERIGMGGAIFAYNARISGANVYEDDLTIDTYTEGIARFLRLMTGQGTGVLSSLDALDAVAFKTVLSKGYLGTHVLDEGVKQGMRDYMTVAPAHNGPYLEAIGVFERLTPKAALIGAFETDFHRTIPLYRRLYATPYSWYEEKGVQKMGYHGASHSYVAEKTGKTGRVISCHLGGSSSICAILDGASQDNSFGFSLQAGIPHNNRVGELDAFVIPFMMGEGLSIKEIERALTKDAGLKGISNTTGDLRDIEKAMDAGSGRAKLAFDMLVDSVKRTIGAYAAQLNGLDQLAFTGGMGEKSARLRSAVCQGLDYLGLSLDEEKNRAVRGEDEVSTESSKVKIWVIPANEELMVVRRAYRCLTQA